MEGSRTSAGLVTSCCDCRNRQRSACVPVLPPGLSFRRWNSSRPGSYACMPLDQLIRPAQGVAYRRPHRAMYGALGANVVTGDRSTMEARGTGECQAIVTMEMADGSQAEPARAAGRTKPTAAPGGRGFVTHVTVRLAPVQSQVHRNPHRAIKSQLIHTDLPSPFPFAPISHQLHLPSYIYGPNSCRIRSRPRA